MGTDMSSYHQHMNRKACKLKCKAKTTVAHLLIYSVEQRAKETFLELTSLFLPLLNRIIDEH